MRRRLGVTGMLLGVGLTAGCTVDDHDAPRPPEEMSRDRTRAVILEVAADAVRKHFGALPAPQRESELPCDSARWFDVDRAYVMQVVWELPLAPEDHERTLRALYNGSGPFTELGDGRFAVSGYDPEKSIGYAVTSGEPPNAVQLSASSPCLLDPE
ncbi:hypothetical protein ACIBJE_29515 [Micromonospora sp. NPDC050187]|uniref:hypothetical protein n=1 Tax=Micromonospora sp. NPDC050187 TaxID=3364277 RepID=UPI00379721FC